MLLVPTQLEHLYPGVMGDAVGKLRMSKDQFKDMMTACVGLLPKCGS
jgi:hypothetical protein